MVKKIEISLVSSLDMILSKKRLIKALISMRKCAGWSMSLLFANPEDRLSQFEAHIMTANVYFIICGARKIVFFIDIVLFNI